MTRMDIQQWERATAAPLMVAAVGFLAAYAIPILNPGLDDRLLVICEAVTWGTWLLFAVNYFCRFGLADDRKRYLLHHILDFLVIILPLVRRLRVLRLSRC